MKTFNKGILGKISLFSIFLFFLLFTLIFVNMTIANSLVYSYERSFFCSGCEGFDTPVDTKANVFLNISIVHFKDEDNRITLIDILPSDWNVIDSAGGKITDSDFYKKIEWDIDLKKNKKIYESNLYDIIEIQKSYTVKSPLVAESKTYNFVSKIDKEVESTKINVLPFSKEKYTEEKEIKYNESEIAKEIKAYPPLKEEIIKPFIPGKKYLKRLRTKPNSKKVYINIPEELFKKEYKIKLYQIKKNSRIDVTKNPKYNVSFIDSDGNGLKDRIEWIIPESSDQEFEVEADIDILNVQSYPTVGGNWTVKFTTKGTADLIIKTIKGTKFGVDLDFIEVRCDNRVLDYKWVNDSIVVSNYHCDGLGYEISKVLTPGKHYLEFEFGGQKAYASNDADMFETGIVETNGWTTVNMKRTYVHPIVVAAPREGYETSADLEVATAVIRNITSSSFEVQLYNETNGALAGNVSYIVVENGTHILSNGILLQAGRYEPVNYYDANGDDPSSYYHINFWTPYTSAPSVIASPNNDSAQDWVAVRYDVGSLTTSGIDISLEIDQTYGNAPVAASGVGNGQTNSIGWIAMNRTSATNMEAGLEVGVDEDPAAGDWRTLSFTNTYTKPLFFALGEEDTGTDPCTVGRQNLNETNVDIRRTEERTDGEQTHATEDVLWMVFESDLGNSPPTTPTNITCNGGSCNISVDENVILNASGSTDPDGDNVTYFIEASLENTTTSGDQESKEKNIKASGTTEAWLNGWNYRKEHTITGSTAGAQTNYQIRIKAYNITGTDNGENVYLGSNVQTNFGDVRFTNSSGTEDGLLDYWIEKYGSNYAIFWVEIDNIPASPDNATIYIYYGNSTVSSASNGTNTFLLYDDFEDGDINGWTTYGSGVCQYSTDSQQGGVILKTANNDPNGCYIALSETVSGFRAEFLTNRINTNGGALDRYSLGGTTTCSGYGPRKQTNGVADDFYIEERSNTCGATTLASTTHISNQNTWYKQMFKYYNQNMNYTM